MKFKILGMVKPKQSTRFCKIGNFVKTYTPADVKSYSNWVKISFLEEYPNFKPLENAVYLTIRAYFRKPKSITKKKLKDIEEGRLFPTKKPDCDNICKQIADSLNGLAWLDDKQIVCLQVFKHYADSDYVEVEFDEFLTNNIQNYIEYIE